MTTHDLKSIEALDRIVTADTTTNGGWKKYVLMWDWHDIQLKGYPGWERDAAGEVLWFDVGFIQGDGLSARQIATQFDDMAVGRFYWRNWTKDGSSSVGKGEAYISRFWFEKLVDKDLFIEKFTVKLPKGWPGHQST